MSESTADMPRLFTIGHSDHELPEFLSLLSRHGINALADVRSMPYSRFNRQFNRESLAEALKRVSIDYIFLGRELGARRSERESYEGDRARYELIRRLPAFNDGLDRIRKGVVLRRVALLCAEKDPLTCHRMILVCRQLRTDPIEIAHILEDGSLETTEQAETRLLRVVGLPANDLFRDRRDLIEQAYDTQSERLAFTENKPSARRREAVP